MIMIQQTVLGFDYDTIEETAKEIGLQADYYEGTVIFLSKELEENEPREFRKLFIKKLNEKEGTKIPDDAEIFYKGDYHDFKFHVGIIY